MFLKWTNSSPVHLSMLILSLATFPLYLLLFGGEGKISQDWLTTQLLSHHLSNTELLISCQSFIHPPNTIPAWDAHRIWLRQPQWRGRTGPPLSLSHLPSLGLDEITAALPVSFSSSPVCFDYDLFFDPFFRGQDLANAEFRETWNNICAGKNWERMPEELLQSSTVCQGKRRRLHLQGRPKHCGEWRGWGSGKK